MAREYKDMNPEERAAGFVSYFQMCMLDESEHGRHWRWPLGRDTAKEWLRLIRAESVSQAEVSALLAIVFRYRHEGSGWYDLAGQVYHWAESNGFAVPPLKVFWSLKDTAEFG
jgi:hypothetical protein